MRPCRTATAWPSCRAITSVEPVDSTSGDRMKTPGNDFPPRPITSRSASKLSTWRPYPLRRTAMSSRPRPFCSAIPSTTSRASTIIPAQVAIVARPEAIALRRGSSNPVRSMSIVIVVLSPPGSTMPSSPSRSSRVRTSRVCAPDFSRARTCSAKAPCIARTPMRGAFLLLRRGTELPASGSEQLFLGDGGDLDTVHRLPQSRGHLGQLFRLVEVRGGRDDRLGTLQGVLGLEDARPDEDAVHSELHHQRRIRRRRNAARGEVHDGQAAQPLALLEDLYRGTDELGLVHELGVVHAPQLADAGVDGARVANCLHDVACSGFALGPDHGRAFGDPAGRLTQVPAAADERHLERVLVDV